MSINVNFSIGLVLGVILAVAWYELKKRKMG